MQELSFVTTKTRLGQNIFDATKIVMSFTPFYTIIGQVWGNNSRFYCPRDKERVSHSKKKKNGRQKGATVFCQILALYTDSR